MGIMVKDRSFYVRLAMLAIPLALQNLITFGVGLADNLMVGSLGDLALSGVFLSNQVQNILQMLNAGIGAAMVVLAAQYIGRDDVKNAKAVIAIAMKIVVIIGVLCTLAVLLLPTQILGLFTPDTEVIAVGLQYIRIVCFTYIFFCLNSALLASMRCVQQVRIGLVSSIVGLLSNIFLNWVFIYGNLGAPALGVEGAAIATLISRIAEFAVSFVYVRFVDTRLMLRLRDLLKTNFTLLGDFFRYGAPVIAGDVLWGLGGAVQVAILGRLGAEVLAANTVASSIFNMVAVFTYGCANASGIIIGQTVGSGDMDKVKAYSKTLQVLFIGVGLITGVLMFFSKDLILAIGFQEISAGARDYVIQFMTVLSVTIVGTAYQMSVLTGIVRAGGATHFVLINDLIFVWLVVIPSALLSAFVFHFPPVVTFACLKCDQILKCFVAVVKVNRYNWMKKLTRETV